MRKGGLRDSLACGPPEPSHSLKTMTQYASRCCSCSSRALTRPYWIFKCLKIMLISVQGSTLNHWPFPWNHLHEGYAYILTHPGTPCVFYDHFMQQHGQLGDTIKSLLKMRKDCGIHSRSKVVVRSATADCYAATIDDKLAMKIGHGDFSPNRHSNDLEFRWHLSASGPNFAVWLNPKYAKD